MEYKLRGYTLINKRKDRRLVVDLNARVDQAKEAGRKSILLLVRRGGDPRFVALTLDQG